MSGSQNANLRLCEVIKNAMHEQNQHVHAILNVPTPVLVCTVGGLLWVFFVATYVMMAVMDAINHSNVG